MVATELSTLAGSAGQVVTVTGRTGPGDGGGGAFYWVPTPAPPEDGGTVFGTTPAGRWRRLWSGYVNVRWFGARGDGVGCHPTQGDTECIQAAIDFCAGQKTGTEVVGGTVFFPPGVYIVSAPTKDTPYKLLLKSKVSLLGCGNASQLRSALNQNYFARTLASAKDTVLEDVTIDSLLIDGRESEQPYEAQKNVERAAVFVYVSRALRIVNCVFRNTADAIRLFQKCAGTRIIGNEISSNPVDIGRECIVMAGALDSIVENNYIHDCPFATAIKMEGADPGIDFSNVIRGNVCKAAGAGITAKGGCIVSDNIIEATMHEGAVVGHHCHFTGNRILSAVATGISLISANDATENVIISNNTISNIRPGQGTTCDGIVAEYYTSAAGAFFEPQNLTISKNIIDNRTENNPGVSFNGIRLHSVGSRIVVDDNEILGADAGIRLNAGSNHPMGQFCAANNIITVRQGGVGIWLSSEAETTALLQHAILSGNLIEKSITSASNTSGIRVQGKPDRLTLIANDSSGADQPLVIDGGPPTNLVMSNNNGF